MRGFPRQLLNHEILVEKKLTTLKSSDSRVELQNISQVISYNQSNFWSKHYQQSPVHFSFMDTIQMYIFAKFQILQSKTSHNLRLLQVKKDSTTQFYRKKQQYEAQQCGVE
ncbi:unnamed protein product [Paramecium octaurelia]|uniref:Uncharacterized protein n=1 Tax=Paramecium octaurelia TaxID=43137 RepID=A0A8S1SJG6_PAROT|nr:unnamed protein product [Paramecium octaurelia]